MPRGFANEEAARRAGMWVKAAVYRDAAAARWCAAHNIPLTKASAESTNVGGGVLVAPAARSVRRLPRRGGRHQHVVGPRYRAAPDSGVTASWTAEGAVLSESQMAFDDVALTAKNMTAFVKHSREVTEDSAIDIATIFARDMGSAFAEAEDDAGVNGVGASASADNTGIAAILNDGNHAAAKVTTASGHNTFLTLDSADLSSLMRAAARARRLAK